jgi:hypothetical protein
MGFVRVHVSAGGRRSIDHRITPEANLVLVAVPSPGIETIFPSGSR